MECFLGRAMNEDAQVELEKECRFTIDVLLQDDRKRAKQRLFKRRQGPNETGDHWDALGMSFSAHISACGALGGRQVVSTGAEGRRIRLLGWMRRDHDGMT